MASAMNGGTADMEKEIREIQELFKGRYPKDVIRDLLNHRNIRGNKEAAVDYLLKGRFSEDREQDDDLQAIDSRLTALNLNDESVAQLKGKIESTVRQFACGGCDRDWWQRVPVRKQVSKCQKCQKRYDPIPRDEEYGWAMYKCDCGHKFSGFGQKHITSSKCYKCGESVLPDKIQPRGRKTRKSDSAHQCDAKDCAFKDCKQGGGRPGTRNSKDGNFECVHPRSRAKKGKRVIVKSSPHTSTGSTVDTFLPQDLGVLSDEEKVVIVSSGDEDERLRSIPEDTNNTV